MLIMLCLLFRFGSIISAGKDYYTTQYLKKTELNSHSYQPDLIFSFIKNLLKCNVIDWSGI